MRLIADINSNIDCYAHKIKAQDIQDDVEEWYDRLVVGTCDISLTI